MKTTKRTHVLTVIVNNDTVSISKQPEYSFPFAETRITTTFTGDNYEFITDKGPTKPARVTLSLRRNAENIEMAKGWQAIPGKLTVQLIYDVSGCSEKFESMIVMESTEDDTDWDEFDVTFEGYGHETVEL